MRVMCVTITYDAAGTLSAAAEIKNKAKNCYGATGAYRIAHAVMERSFGVPGAHGSVRRHDEAYVASKALLFIPRSSLWCVCRCFG